MVGAAESLGYKKSQIIAKNEAPGAFTWDTYPELFLIKKEVVSVQLGTEEAPLHEGKPLHKEESLCDETLLHKKGELLLDETLLPKKGEPLLEETLLPKKDKPLCAEELLRKEETLRKETQLRSAEKIITRINDTLQTLEDNIGQVDQHHFSAAVAKASTLLASLRTATSIYSAALVSGINIQDAEIQFKRGCEAAIIVHHNFYNMLK